MPRLDDIPSGAPCWVDLFTSEPDRARSFYGELFAWTSETAGDDYGGYLTFSKDGEPVAGGMRNDGSAGTPDTWSIYLASEDAEKTVAAASGHGAQVIVPPMQVGEMGTMAVITDAGGAAVGVWQPAVHRGFTLVAEPGAPAWFECHTRAYDATVAFYRDVFGWDTHVEADTPEFRYTTFGAGQDALAGIMDDTAASDEDAPAAWAVYFQVEDTDAALRRVEELGGRVVMPAEDTPYGRLGVATDPTGAAFRLIADG
jgi:uncharacterized protein